MHNLNFTPFPEMRTENLVLRKIQIEDINEYFILKSDLRLLVHYEAKAKNLAETKKKLESINEDINKNEAILWGIALKGADKIIGSICYWNISEDGLKAEIGYELMVDWQGRGIMNEAVQAVVKYGFNQMGLEIIEACPNATNIKSLKLLERNKFIKKDSPDGLSSSYACYSLKRQ